MSRAVAVAPPLKSYHLFAGKSHYPSGGAEDFVATIQAQDVTHAVAQVAKRMNNSWDWWHLTDEAFAIVEQGTLN